MPTMDPVLNFTKEYKKPTKKAKTTLAGLKFPVCRKPNISEVNKIPIHKPNTRSALCWINPRNTSSSTSPVQIIIINTGTGIESFLAGTGDRWTDASVRTPV